MEEQSHHTNPIHTIVAAVLVAVAGYILYTSVYVNRYQSQAPHNALATMSVLVENTIAKDGVLTPPENFPTDIPLEPNQIIESAVTHHPLKQAEQLSLSYISLKTATEKYQEYLKYMRQAGYIVKEESSNPSNKIVTGVKDGIYLYVDVDGHTSRTSVYLSYMKPVSK